MEHRHLIREIDRLFGSRDGLTLISELAYASVLGRVCKGASIEDGVLRFRQEVAVLTKRRRLPRLYAELEEAERLLQLDFERLGSLASSSLPQFRSELESYGILLSVAMIESARSMLRLYRSAGAGVKELGLVVIVDGGSGSETKYVYYDDLDVASITFDWGRTVRLGRIARSLAYQGAFGTSINYCART